MGFKVGEYACFSKTVTESDVYGFAGITGDFNSVHTDREEAKKGVFGERIAHGFLTAGFISTVLGMYLPGPGTIYLSQSLNFKRPVKIGDTVTAKATVIEILDEYRGIYKLETVCTNQYKEIVIEGEAVVKHTDRHEARDAGVENTFYNRQELKGLGLKSCGENVLISRNAVIYHPEQLEVGNNVRIDDFTTISGKVVLGDYIHIAQFCSLYGGSEGIYMSDFSGLSSRVVIYATSNDYSGNSMTNPMVPQKYKTTDKNAAVTLCRHVVVGCGSVILPGVTIAEGCSVGAMSLCGKSTEAWNVYAGIPARRIKERSKKLLELERQFREDTGLPGGGGIAIRHMAVRQRGEGGMKAECINTGRLMLRDIDEQDTELIVKWRSDPEIYKFFRYPHCLTAQEHLEWYRKYYLRDKQRYIWMAIEMKDNVSIGTFGLKKAEGCEAEISYLVAPEAQGKGYAYEAVDFLIAWAEKKWHSRAVFAEIHYKNEASIRFVQRLGFEKSGVNENFLIYKRML